MRPSRPAPGLSLSEALAPILLLMVVALVTFGLSACAVDSGGTRGGGAPIVGGYGIDAGELGGPAWEDYLQ